MSNLYKRSIIFVLLLVVYQCTEEISSKLKVIVLNNQNVPIHNATILLDDIKIGTTDKDGIYYHELKGVKGKSLKLEVTKDSSTHYYAPYFEKIVLSPDKHSPIKVKAILYSVPKPKKDKGVTTNSSIDEEDDLPILVDTHSLDDGTSKRQEKMNLSMKIAGPDTKINESIQKKKSNKPVINLPEQTVGLNIDRNRPFQGDLDNLSIDANNTIYTLHVTSQKKNIANAEVYLGDPARGFLKSACKTNQKGKCTIKLYTARNKVLSFVVKKQGYITKTLSTRLKKKGFLRVPLTRGQCLDVFTLKSNYQYLRGVSGINIYVNGRKVGQTDKFGHLSYVYQGPSNDLLKVAFKTKRYLPEVFETDFITSPKMTLTRFLTDKTPPKPRFTLLPVRLAGSDENTDKISDIKKVNRYLHSANKFILAKNGAFEFPYASLIKHLEEEGKKVNDVIKHGWTSLNIKAHVDALILPTIVFRKGIIHVDTSLYNNKGEVIAAATHKLSDLNNRMAYTRLMKGLANKISNLFPFEGAVLSASEREIKINLNKQNTPFLTESDLIEVFGRQINPLGSAQEHKKIAIAKIKSVTNKSAAAELVWQSPRSVLGRGDMIILRKGVTQDNLKSRNYPIKISESQATGKGKGVPQVNVYLNNRWLGSSNEHGLVAIRNTKELSKGGALTFVKHGYEIKNLNLSGVRKKQLAITLNRLLAFVQIDSKPAGAKVYLDGIYVGQTPLNQPFKTSSGFLKLKIKAPPGYKDVAQVLELEEGVLDLTGGASILLERDVLKGINDLINLESYDKAISMLENVDRKHSDYLYAQHLLGEVYLGRLKDPVSAARAFEKVISNPRVKSLHNKKFVGTYINYVQALSEIAKKEEREDWKSAKVLYEKVLAFGETMQDHLKFTPSSQRLLASKKLKYYEALATAKLAANSRDRVLKRQSMEKWKEFVATYGDEKKPQKEVSDLLGNAKVYLKQAKSTIYQNDVNM